jgi:CRISPR system Cascade subunit CasC
VRRARVSSQSFKRAIREAPVFAKTTQVEPAKRTRRVVKMLRPPLRKAGKSDEDINNALAFFVPNYLAKLGSKLEKPDDDARTKVMVFISEDEVQVIAEALLEHWDKMVLEDKKTRRSVVRDLTKKFKDTTGAPDIALFGRMLAQKPVLNIDAACQVAHALSTHRVTMEMDFWTAVDDLKKLDADDEADAGAGGMGFTGFDSACFYRYVRLDWEQLLKNLGGDVDLARRSVEAFMRALVEAVPSGKQNSFAAHNPPSLMFATVREGSFGWSLTNAFERPVYPRRNEGLVTPSVAALDTYWQRLTQVYGEDSIQAQAALALDPDLPLESLAKAEVSTLDDWIKTTLAALPHEEA